MTLREVVEAHGDLSAQVLSTAGCLLWVHVPGATMAETDRVAHTLRDRLGCVVVVDGTPGATLQALDHEAVEALRDKCQRFLDGVP